MSRNLITRDNKGFVLVEVLITVVILSVGLTFITRSMMMSLKALDITEQYTQGYLLLEQKMWEFEQKGFIESDLDVEESFNQPNEEFRYRLVTESVADDESGLLNQVTLSVNWPVKKEKREISLTTFLKNKTE